MKEKGGRQKKGREERCRWGNELLSSPCEAVQASKLCVCVRMQARAPVLSLSLCKSMRRQRVQASGCTRVCFAATKKEVRPPSFSLCTFPLQHFTSVCKSDMAGLTTRPFSGPRHAGGPRRLTYLPGLRIRVAPRASPDPPGPTSSSSAQPPPQPADPDVPPPALPASALPADMWSLKPAWCQPWSIIGTGVIITAGASALNPWLGGAAGFGVAAWWWLFLVIVPADYAAYAAAAREKAGQQQEQQQQ